MGKHIIAVVQLNKCSITPDKAQSINLTVKAGFYNVDKIYAIDFSVVRLSLQVFISLQEPVAESSGTHDSTLVASVPQ